MSAMNILSDLLRCMKKLLLPLMVIAGVGGLIGMLKLDHDCDVRRQNAEAGTKQAEEKAKAKEEASWACIQVQYDANGNAFRCVISHANGVILPQPKVEGEMNDWHTYKTIAAKLGIDPEKCIVWDWKGKE